MFDLVFYGILAEVFFGSMLWVIMEEKVNNIELRYRICHHCISEALVSNDGESNHICWWTWEGRCKGRVRAFIEKGLHVVGWKLGSGVVERKWRNPFHGVGGRGSTWQLCHRCRYGFEHGVLGGS